MEEKNKNSITYEENWNTAYEPEYPKIISNGDYSEDEDNEIEQKPIKKKKNKDSPKQLLVTFQLILCILIALAAFVLKSIGGDIYKISREWYYSQLNKSVIFDDNNKTPDLDSLFGSATKDEA